MGSIIMLSSIRNFLITISLLTLTACGGGSDNTEVSNKGGDVPPDNMQPVNNQAVLGPLAGAEIRAYRLTDLENPVEGPIESDQDMNNLSRAGNFALQLRGIPDDEWVLVTATKGWDIDADDNNEIDNSPTENKGTVRAIATAKMWRDGGQHVNPLTDVASRMLEKRIDLGAATSDYLESELNSVAPLLTESLDGEEQSTYKDILKFNPRIHRDFSKVSWDKMLSDYVSAIHDGESNDNLSARTDLVAGETDAINSQQVGDFKIYDLTRIPNEFSDLPDYQQEAFINSVSHLLLALFPAGALSWLDISNFGLNLFEGMGAKTIYGLSCFNSDDYKTLNPTVTVFAPRMDIVPEFRLDVIAEDRTVSFFSPQTTIKANRASTFFLNPLEILGSGQSLSDTEKVSSGIYRENTKIGFELFEKVADRWVEVDAGRCRSNVLGDDYGDDPYEASFSTPAINIGDGSHSVTGFIDDGGDSDVFAVELSEAGEVSINGFLRPGVVANATGVVTQLYDADYSFLGEERSNLGSIKKNLQAGTYFIRVYSAQPWVSLNWGVSIRVTASPVTEETMYPLTVRSTTSATFTSVPAGIDCGSDCTASFQEGTTVTISFDINDPNNNDVTFGEWDGDCSGSSNTCTVVMDQPRSVGASFSASAPSPDLIMDRYQPIGSNGEIIRDVITGLEWQRCSVGQTWTGSTCSGSALTYNWDDAIELTSPGGFRIPTIEQLRTIVYCSNPGNIGQDQDYTACDLGTDDLPKIVLEAFPNTSGSNVWSGSPRFLSSAWAVDFNLGYVRTNSQNYPYQVRLVRVRQ